MFLCRNTKGTLVKWKWRSLAKIPELFATILTSAMVWCIGQATQCNCSMDLPRGLMHCLTHLELLIFCINGLKLWDWVTATQIKPEMRCINFTCWCIKMESWLICNSFSRFFQLLQVATVCPHPYILRRNRWQCFSSLALFSTSLESP